CTFCLWPQVTQGHSYRTRSPESVYEEVSQMKAKFPKMKELFFDDDTFTADPARARKIAQLLKNIKKGVGLERARRFTRDCHEIGILIHGTFILGLPGETKDTIQESM